MISARETLAMRVDPPDGFIDEYPERGPWFVEAVKPTRFTTVQLIFGDRSTAHGQWTGLTWWSHFRDKVPLGWRQVPKLDLRSIKNLDLRVQV
jgi:hypothetical protein